MGIATAIWEKWIEFKYEWKKITAAALVSPVLLYDCTRMGPRLYDARYGQAVY